MKRLLTTLLVWLLMATLPLHAVAASVNLSCARAAHHAGATSIDRQTMPAASDAHAHHQEHGAEAGDGLPYQTTTDVADTTTSDLPHSSCSACSVFCVGAVAPPSALVFVPGIHGAESVVIAPANFTTGFIPDGPQRPPRQ